jgi:hypothetical protein
MRSSQCWSDTNNDRIISCYRNSSPDQATIFRVGEFADAEPAMPGWTLDVAWLFA